MRYKFREFKDVGRRQVDIPKITITRAGRINFNKKFYEENWRYIDGDYVIFHYDPENTVIGLEFVIEFRSNTYPVRELPSGNGATVSAKAFLKHNEIPFDKTRSYKIERYELEDKNKLQFFVVDLKQ